MTANGFRFRKGAFVHWVLKVVYVVLWVENRILQSFYLRIDHQPVPVFLSSSVRSVGIPSSSTFFVFLPRHQTQRRKTASYIGCKPLLALQKGICGYIR